MTPTTEQLKDLLAKVTPGEWKWHDYDDCNDGNVTAGRLQSDEPVIWHCECVSPSDATLIALAPTLAAEVVRLRAIIEKVDQYTPVADSTCDEPSITFTEAIMRQCPELRPPNH